ncbi:MAG TPA: lamin tail domain-containing protein [Verrucomicrobiae bacterium]|nr:lamin tail domain-containing protein [Verrucomicrobiae bacterium]
MSPEPGLNMTFRYPAILVALTSCISLFAQMGTIVINEINYAPNGDGNPAEFIELYNPGTNSVDLSGWRFDSGITYTFPAGSLISSNGFVVISGDPARFAARWGFTPLGPWSGRLANEGEQVRLRDAGNGTLDSVTYGIGFPWPTAARKGSSMELIHPLLNNALPGSWRSSGQASSAAEPQSYIPANDVSWRYRKGTSEASSPISSWRELGFVENATWATGRTSIGYGDSDDHTILSDMRNGYRSLFLRRVFVIEEGQIPAALKLKARVDDGCIVWINGTEVARFHVSPGLVPTFDSEADNHDADVVAFEETNLLNAAAFLNAGSNIVAVQAFNSSIGSTDFSIDVALEEWVGDASTAPTPGLVNSCFSSNAPPSIDQVEHSPAQPASGEEVIVTAWISDPDGVASATLRYQAVNPGSYLRKTDPSYSTSWLSVAMNDAGADGDVVAGDMIFTGRIPAVTQTNRRLVRYTIEAADSSEQLVRVPYADDGSPNFGYFVYDGIPEWRGAFKPGVTPVNTYPPSVIGSLPAYHLIANRTDVINSQYESSYNGQRFYGTLVYDGQVYDHVQFNNRGEGSTYVTGKNKWRIHFNTAREFQARDNWGQPYGIPWDELNLNAGASPWCAVHRGMAGVEEAVSFRLYELLGLASSRTHFVHFRVIDDASETGTSQFQGGDASGVNGGDLWGVYLAIEQPDGSFLDERGLEDGNVYKIEGNNGDQKHQGDDQPSDGSDWAAFRNASGSGQSEAWWRQNMNLEAFYNFHAGNRFLGNVDLRTGFNHYFYHAPDNRWQVIPWDLDMMFIPKEHQGGTIVQNNCLNVAAIRLEFRNRARELLDLIGSDAGTNGGQIGQLIHEYASIVAPPGTKTNWVTLDAAMWNLNPRTRGDENVHSGQTSHRGNFFWTPFTDDRIGGTWVRTLATPDFAGSMRYLLDYTTDKFPAGNTWSVNNGDPRGYGYRFLQLEGLDGLAPSRPSASHVGAAGFQVDDLRFQASAYAGPQPFMASQWRVGEISAPGIPLHNPNLPWIYEVTDVWRSAEILSNGVASIPAGVLELGRTYRVRVRHKDITGRWSRWSQPVQFVPVPGASTVTRSNLVISEFMYNPSAASAGEAAAGYSDKQLFEYVELLNVSTNELELEGLEFTTGITFEFSAGAKLSPGARTLVVNDTNAFAMRYGDALPVAGIFSGNLNNSGEQLVLAFNGDVIHDFLYSDGSHPEGSDPWPAAADGSGSSLVLMNPETAPEHNVPGNWRSSTSTNGSPNRPDLINYEEWKRRYPALGSAQADDDDDGWSNESEYVFGTSPTDFTEIPETLSARVQTLNVNGSEEEFLVVESFRSAESGDVVFGVEFSSDLFSWPFSGIFLDVTTNSHMLIERWRFPVPASDAGKAFGRARAYVR